MFWHQLDKGLEMATEWLENKRKSGVISQNMAFIILQLKQAIVLAECSSFCFFVVFKSIKAVMQSPNLSQAPFSPIYLFILLLKTLTNLLLKENLHNLFAL